MASSPSITNLDLDKLRRVCALVGHPEWMVKSELKFHLRFERLAILTAGTAARPVLLALQRWRLEVLIRMLEDDAQRIVGLTASLRLALENVAPTSPAVQKPRLALLDGPKEGPLAASWRQALLAALEQDPTLPGGEPTRSLLGELDLAEKQMWARIEEFLRGELEEPRPEPGAQADQKP
jgi:hypothetical protein